MEDYTPEQQASMEAEALARIDAVEQTTAEQAGEVEANLEGYNDPTTPEPILGKFKSQDDLIKAYQELEKKLGQPEVKPEVVEDTTKKEEVEPTVEDDTTVNPADLTEFINDYSTNGKLSEDSYTKLKEMGISKQIADAYIAGQKALVDSTVAKSYEAVGGRDNYDNMINWAKDNLTPEQKSGFNKQLATGDAEIMSMAIDGLYQKYQSVNRVPTRIKGDSVPQTTTNVFNDRTEHDRATSNRLYGNDAKYTAMVDQKYLRSLQAGTV